MIRPLRHVSVRLTIPLAVVLPALLVAGVLVTVFWMYSRAAADRAAEAELDLLHARIADRTSALLETPRRTALFTAGRVRSRPLDPRGLRAWLRPMAATIAAFEGVRAVTWGDRDGRATWVARYAGDANLTYAILDEQTPEGVLEEYDLDDAARLAAEPKASYKYDPRGRPWFRAPVDAARPTWSEPFAWIAPDGLSATLGISFGVPINDEDGSFLGVIDSELTLYEISVFLARLNMPEGGIACVLDNEGFLIATSIHEPVVTPGGDRIRAAEAADPRIVAAGLALPGSTAAAVDGIQTLLLVRDLASDSLPPWRVVTVVPEDAFLAGAKAARTRGLLIAAGALLASLAVGLLVALAIVRPILALRREAARIGTGDLDTPVDVDAAPEFASLSAAMNEMIAGLQDRLGLRHALSVAMEVQQGLLPDATPNVTGLDIAGHSSYCDETGGDYYDYLDIAGLGEDAAAIAVGDVMGHGVAAAMLMATARGILRSRATQHGELGSLLKHMNDLLVQDTGGTRFMTMLLMTLDAGVIRWASAGHPAPFVLRPGSDAFDEQAYGGMPLGVSEAEAYDEHTTDQLPPGTVIVASTDGLWEAADTDATQFGLDRLAAVVAEHREQPAEAIANAIRDAHAAFVGSQPQDDDITFVVARLRERPDAAPTSA